MDTKTWLIEVEVAVCLAAMSIVALALTRSPKLKWPGCVKMLEQKRFGKIAAIPAAVWLNFSKAFLKRLMQTGRFNFGVRF